MRLTSAPDTGIRFRAIVSAGRTRVPQWQERNALLKRGLLSKVASSFGLVYV
jgi:hypothetical protein